ncbi:DUF4861 family protein [Aquimarina algiphila]|uniref:DUF4861 family protein n=1 Tax=Aquimarina algiphila TaxID=2047982 RepID=UPI002490ED06|nr:DUF4861 family protein [Aquimarina algiphila]
MKSSKSIFFIASILLLQACAQKKEEKIILIKNSLNIERTFETVTLTKDFLNITDLTIIGIRDLKTNELQITQTVDINNDGIADELLFQPKIQASSEKEYVIIQVLEEQQPKTTTYCYSRFVPERTDDYAWENNKVAFRVFGPTAQKMAEDSIKGGTLSSGVDAWLKKVEYPIINKWYKENDKNVGSYHIDHGEGLDNFHVGISRGVGGIAVKKDSVYYYSKNFTKWRTITTGPIRTSFYLEYESWDAGGNQIKECKFISLDYGSNLSKFETAIEGTQSISVGLTLHEKDGEITENTNNAWVSYWQPHKESTLGTAIIAPEKYFLSLEKYDSPAVDESNAYAHLKVIDNAVIYYAGFGWKESSQFTTKQEWEGYLNDFSEKLKNPLSVSLK